MRTSHLALLEAPSASFLVFPASLNRRGGSPIIYMLPRGLACMFSLAH